MILIGMDIASMSGYSIYDTQRSKSEIRVGNIECENADTTWGRSLMGKRIVKFCERIRKQYGADPSLFVIEAKLQRPVDGAAAGGWGNVTSELHGAICSHLTTMNIAWATIASQTWRKTVFGEGYKPPLIQKKDRDGNLKVLKDGKPDYHARDWKAKAIEECERLKITLPEKKAHGREDAAEAAMLVQAWYEATPQGPHGLQVFQELLKRRNDKLRAA
jgi:hypothetical protein